jgi:hypothetical protein
MNRASLSEDARIKLIRPDELVGHTIYQSDFNDIYDQYFRDFIIKTNYAAAPSGVFTSHSDASEYIPPMHLSCSSATNYIIDDNYMSIDVKRDAHKIMQRRENFDIANDELTISPSVSHATGIILITLKQLGIKKFYCVAPAYFSVVEQALYLDFDVHLVHGDKSKNYNIDTEHLAQTLPKTEPYILTMFNPLYPIGLNLQNNYMSEFINSLPKNAHLIIDEAQDRSYPSILSNIKNNTQAKVYRIFGIFKSLGLHGAKAALILHPAEFRKRITETSESIGGTLDKYSASLLAFLSNNEASHLQAINAANVQITRNHKILEGLIVNPQISTFPVENGFLGCIIADIGNQEYLEFRQKLLTECRRIRIPVAIGSTQFFPYSGKNELIRINYYQKQSDFEQSILLLDSCLSRSIV